MIDVNWDLAPEGAEELVQFESHVTWRKGIKIWCMVQEDWRDYVSDFKTIATRPTQTKTVADAWEYYQENGKICGYSFSQNKMLSFCKSNDTYCFVSEKSSAGSVETDDWQPICTHEQFEAYVKEQESKQEGEKWTHVVDDDEGQLTKCRKHLKLCNGSDWVYVCEKGEYFVPSKMGYCGVKPIKPTISKAEAWDLCQDYEGSQGMVKYMLDLHDQYDIVEVPAND